jgi:cytochrome c peroxidase
MGPNVGLVRNWVLLGTALALGTAAACSSDSAPPTTSSENAAGQPPQGGAMMDEPGGQPPVGGNPGAAGMPMGGEPQGGAGNGGAEPTAGEGGGGAGGDGGDGGDGSIGAKFPKYPTVVFPSENPFSADKAMLGKILFWDEQLSSDNTVACGTCHRAGSGGSDPRGASPLSRHPGADPADPADDIHGAQGIKRCTASGSTITYKADAIFGLNVQVTKRRPPSYLDAMFASDLFWDGRAKSTFIDPDSNQVAIADGGGLESQAVGPPLNDGEMACEARTWPLIHQKLKTAVPLTFATDVPPDMKAALVAHPTYPELFQAAYGTTEINTKRIAFAIATHERRLTSDQTPWDRYNAGDPSALTAGQRRGLELFLSKGKCKSCHAPPLFSDLVFHNLGFVASDFDTGRQVVTGQVLDRGKVKTPTLRNVGLREPAGLLHFGYGPGADLQAVMSAYNQPPNADGDRTDPQLENLNLSRSEIDDMVDFMRNSLTDPRVAAELPPFDRPKLSSEQ